MSPWLGVAAVLGATGVLLGAFGAHGLAGRVGPEQVASWQTAVQYHLLHAVVLLVLALAGGDGKGMALPAALFTVGVLLFSGSIYLLVLTPWRWLGPVTPLGGLCLVAAWISLLFASAPRS